VVRYSMFSSCDYMTLKLHRRCFQAFSNFFTNPNADTNCLCIQSFAVIAKKRSTEAPVISKDAVIQKSPESARAHVVSDGSLVQCEPQRSFCPGSAVARLFVWKTWSISDKENIAKRIDGRAAIIPSR